MARLKRIAISLAYAAAEFGCLYAWKFEGVEGARNLLIADAVFQLVVSALLVASTPKDPLRPGLPRRLAVALDLALVLALTWFGHGWLAAMFALATFLHAVFRDRFNADGSVKAGV